MLKFPTYITIFLPKLESVQLELGGSRVPFFMEEATSLQDGLLLFLQGIHSEEEAKQWVGCRVYAPLDSLVPMHPFEYHPLLLIGYQASDASAGLLGPIVSLEDNPAHTLLVISYQGKSILVPFVPAFIAQADHENKTLHLTLPTGLLEVYTTDTHVQD
jgi:16S rRNA processing protein RimM